jgi:hypothetical protein
MECHLRGAYALNPRPVVLVDGRAQRILCDLRSSCQIAQSRSHQCYGDRTGSVLVVCDMLYLLLVPLVDSFKIRALEWGLRMELVLFSRLKDPCYEPNRSSLCAQGSPLSITPKLGIKAVFN